MGVINDDGIDLLLELIDFVILSAAKDLDDGDIIATHGLIMCLRHLDSSLHCVTLRMTIRAIYLHNKSL